MTDEDWDKFNQHLQDTSMACPGYYRNLIDEFARFVDAQKEEGSKMTPEHQNIEDVEKLRACGKRLYLIHNGYCKMWTDPKHKIRMSIIDQMQELKTAINKSADDLQEILSYARFSETMQTGIPDKEYLDD